MRSLLLAAGLALIGTAAASVPPGAFQTWMPSERAPLTFTSQGVTVSVASAPCPEPAIGDTTCRWDGYNNQGVLIVTAPGLPPVRVLTDRQSMYARIAVVQLDRRDAAPGVVIESQSGGSGGDMTALALAPMSTGFRVVPLAPAWGRLQGQIASRPADLSGDGVTDFVLADARFDSVFGCNACTPRPPVVLAISNGALKDESRDPALAGVFRRDMVRQRARCASTTPDRNGACAAYVADAARAGRLATAWADMLRHYDRQAPERWPVRPGRPVGGFPASLRAFLIRTGYIPV